MILTRVSPLTITLTAILTAFCSAEHKDQLAIADFPILSGLPPSVHDSNEVATLPFRQDETLKQDSQTLDERDINFGWYSRAYDHGYLRQWIFGNATKQFNISMSNCIKAGHVVGIYQSMDGTNHTTATIADIYKDLGYSDTHLDPKKILAQFSVNAQAAYEEILAFLLTSIFCSGDALVGNELRRRLLSRSDRGILTVILQGAGDVVSYFIWNGKKIKVDDPGIKLLFGGIGTFFLEIVVGLLDLLRQEATLEPVEAAFMGTVLAAKARSVILKMKQSGRLDQDIEPCLPATQMAAALALAGSGSAPVQDLGVLASTDVSNFQAACAAKQVAE